MTKDAPAFDFYPERWLAGVADLSDAEQIAYLRLLCHQWLRDGLPVDATALARLAGGRKLTEAVLAKFPEAEDGKRRNPRLETVRREQRARINKSREKIEKMNSARLAKTAGARGVSSEGARGSKGRSSGASNDASSGRSRVSSEVARDPQEARQEVLQRTLQEALAGAQNPLLSASSPPTTHHSPFAGDKPPASTAAAAEGGLALPPAAKATSPCGAKKESAADPRHAEFVSLWCERFPQHHPTAYHFQGGKDGSTLKRFLATSRLTAAELLQIALRCWTASREAYAPGWLHGASSIHGFCTDFNRLAAYQRPATARPKPRHAAYNAADATAGMTGPEIGDF